MDEIAQKAAQEISKFESKVREYVDFAKNANTDRTNLISIIMKSAYRIITHDRVAIMFAIAVVRLNETEKMWVKSQNKVTELESKLKEAESKLAEAENELKYWSNR